MTQAMEAPNTHEVVVIGAGPAGLTAAMYAARQGLSTAVVAGEVGGQAAWATRIDNYLGWHAVSGRELVDAFRDHVSLFDVSCFEGVLVNALVQHDNGFEVATREGLTLRGSAVIVATGKTPRRLAIPGELDFLGRGVSYCATCDAAFFTGKNVVVVGPGESAADAALQLSSLGARVLVLSERPLKAPLALLARLKADPAIALREGTTVARIEGGQKVSGVVLAPQTGKTPETIPVEGVFIETGAISAAEFAAGLVDINDRGEIVVDRRCATSHPGIYAAGDATDGLGKQVIIAAGEGARAAIAAGQDLKRR